MTDFVWLGAVDTDMGNMKNWHDATSNVAATRTPGTNPDNTDNIWFVKTTGITTLTGSLTSGINDCYFLAGAVSNYTIGAYANQNGITSAWEVHGNISCNDMVVGYTPGTGKANTTHGFAADRVTFKSSSVIVVADQAYCVSGTYEGSFTAAELNLANSAVDSFVGTSGTFTVDSQAGNKTVQCYKATTVKTLHIASTNHEITLDCTTLQLKADLFTSAAAVLHLCGGLSLPITSAGECKFNGGTVNIWTNNSKNTADVLELTGTQTLETITASPSVSTITEISCTRAAFPTNTTLSLGGVLTIGTTEVQSSASSSTTASDYTVFCQGAMIVNSVSVARFTSTNTNTSKYINLYAKASCTGFVGLGIAPSLNQGILNIVNDSKATLMGPLGMGTNGTVWTGELVAEIREDALGGHKLKNPSAGGTKLTLAINTGSTFMGDAINCFDIDTSIPIVLDGGGNNVEYDFKYATSGTPYKFTDLTFIQSAKCEFVADEVVEISGDLSITGGEWESTATIQMDKAGDCNLTCTAQTSSIPIIRIGVTDASATNCTYSWTSTADQYPRLQIRNTSSVKVGLATTGANRLEGAGTFNWNGGLTATNHLFYITNHTGTPIANTVQYSNPNYLSGYRTAFRFDCRQNGSYSITLPTAISGDVELGSSGSPGISSGNDPIYNCPAACVITGGLKIDYSGYANSSTYNAKVNVGSATNELQVTGDVTIGTKGYCAAQIKVTNGNFTNNGTVASNKLSLISSTAAEHNANLGSSCTVASMLIDGQGLTSKYNLSGSATVSGTYTLTDASITLADSATTTCQSIAVTGASACVPNHHLFVLSGGGSINDSSTESRTVAGLTFVGCESLGAIKVTTGNTAIVGSVIVDSIILRGGNITQNSGTAKKLWIRGGTHPSALENDYPGYKVMISPQNYSQANFSNVAINGTGTGTGGSFVFPSSGTNFHASDTLIVGNANNAGMYFAGDVTLTLGCNPNADLDTKTIVKWNTSLGICFGPASTWNGSCTIRRCDIEGTVDMSEPLLTTENTVTSGSTKLFTMLDNKIHSSKEMAMFRCTSKYYKFVVSRNRFSAKGATAIIKYDNHPDVTDEIAANTEISYNHIRSLSTSGTIVNLSRRFSDEYLFYENVLCSDTMTSGVAFEFAPQETMVSLRPNKILVKPGVTPIDVSSLWNGGTMDMVLTGWYFDVNTPNFGKRCQGLDQNWTIVSQFTNEEVNSKYVLAGVRTSAEPFLVQHEDLQKWKATSGSNPVSSIVNNNKVYRYARSEAATLQSKDFYVGGSPIKATWDEYDGSNPVAIVANYSDGATTTTQAVVNGTELTVPASCAKLWFTATLAASEGFGNFKLVDGMGRIFFTDELSTNKGTQSASRTEVGPASTVGFGYTSPDVSNAASVVPHINAQYDDPVNQSVWLYVRGSNFNSGTHFRWVVLLGEQDSNDWYRFTVEQASSGTNNDKLTIEKSVSGTITSLVTKTDCNFTAGDSQTDTIIKATRNFATNALTLSISGTTTTAWSFNVSASDSTHTTGNWGWATDGASEVQKVQVYDGIDGTQVFMNGADLTFMPDSQWKFPTTVTNVELRDCTANGNQSTLLPNLYGSHTTVINNVTFIQSTLPTSITQLVVIKDSVLSVSGDVTITGSGRLHLIGCKLTPSVDRWKFIYDGITYNDSPPLVLQGNMLVGMHTTITPSGESLFVVDDATKNTAVIRAIPTKDLNITRNAVLGLNYERMIFNGFDSRTVILTVQSVNDAGIIGKLEEMFMNNQLLEVTTPYCHIWKAKIVGFTSRYLNSQANALQAQVTFEEWRDD